MKTIELTRVKTTILESITAETTIEISETQALYHSPSECLQILWRFADLTNWVKYHHKPWTLLLHSLISFLPMTRKATREHFEAFYHQFVPQLLRAGLHQTSRRDCPSYHQSPHHHTETSTILRLLPLQNHTAYR